MMMMGTQPTEIRPPFDSRPLRKESMVNRNVKATYITLTLAADWSTTTIITKSNDSKRRATNPDQGIRWCDHKPQEP